MDDLSGSKRPGRRESNRIDKGFGIQSYGIAVKAPGDPIGGIPEAAIYGFYAVTDIQNVIFTCRKCLPLRTGETGVAGYLHQPRSDRSRQA